MTIVQTSLKSKNYNALGIDEIADDITNIITILNSIILYGLPVAADGVTIIGAGTVGDPLIAVGGGSSTTTTVNISSAQILTIGTSSIELLPAPGVGMYYDIEKMIFEFNYVSGFAYNDMAGDFFEIRYTDFDQKTLGVVNGTLISQAVAKAAILKEFTELDPIVYANEVIAKPFTINKQIHLGTYNYANLTDNGQTATMRAIITYTVRTLGA